MHATIRCAVSLSLFLLLPVPAVAGPHRERAVIEGDSAYAHLGRAVAGVGDVNGDGAPDWMAGAPDAGYALVVSGADGSVLFTLPSGGGDGFGTAVATAGDANGDGRPDCLVGAPGSNHACVYSGVDGMELVAAYGSAIDDRFGESVDGVGDVDGDGHDDFVAGAPYGTDSVGRATGYAGVFSGADGSRIHSLRGESIGGQFGTCVAGIGDADGDGVPDIAVGAPYDRNPGDVATGSVYLFSGADGSTIRIFYGESDRSEFGYSVDGVGDIDGDGCADIVVGAPREQGPDRSTFGMVAVFSGGTGKLLYEIHAAQGQDLLGDSVCGAGDLDSDGVPDWLAGAPAMLDEAGEALSGGAIAWSGKDGRIIATVRRSTAYGFFGDSLAGVGDVNGDGRDDFVVGASREDALEPETGSASLFVSPGPTGTVTIDGGAPATASSRVTLTLSWAAGDAAVTKMRIRNSGSDFGDWVDLSSSVPWDLKAGEGARAVDVQFLDEDRLYSSESSDSIVVDQTGPSGSFALANGAEWTNGSTVGVTLKFKDGGSGVAEVRFRNAGEAWSPWQDAAQPIAWTLADGTGTKTVDGQCRDRVGNLSPVSSDSIGIDREAPNGSIEIQGGATFLTVAAATVTVSASDTGGSGLTAMRYRASGSADFGPWLAFATTCDVSWPWTEGEQAVDFQFQDGAGNISMTTTDSAILDFTPPSVLTLEMNGGRPYLLPEEPVEILLSTNPDTSGADSFRASFDGGTSWSEWNALADEPVAVGRPDVDGPVAVVISIRDFAGNESEPIPAGTIYSLGRDQPCLGCSGRCSGTFSDGSDVDAVYLELVRGDVLKVKLKAIGSEKKAGVPARLDLAHPEGVRVLTGVEAIDSFVVPHSGRYVLVIRQQDGSGPGRYSVSVAVKQARANTGVKTIVASGELCLEAAAGTTLRGSLAGPGLDPASVSIVGPDGAVAVVVTGKPGKAKFSVRLDSGTGTYQVRFTSAGPADVGLKATLPGSGSLVEAGE